ncbi:MAG: hypothetical protein AB7P03_14530 [Kofleriaceae bacterium]
MATIELVLKIIGILVSIWRAFRRWQARRGQRVLIFYFLRRRPRR